MPIGKKIERFIRRHHVMTLATVADSQPWCSNLFYAWMPAEQLFVFTSDKHTRHAREALANRQVAASIVLETCVVGRIQGLQISGTARPCGDELAAATKAYLKRFPYAALAELELWVLEPGHMKLTDNTLGFGKKEVWEAGR